MIGFLLRTAITGLGIWLAVYLVPGVSAASTGALVWGRYEVLVVSRG